MPIKTLIKECSIKYGKINVGNVILYVFFPVLNKLFCLIFLYIMNLFYRLTESHSMPSQKAQDKPQTPDTFHHCSALGPRAEVPSEAILVYRRTCWVFQLTQLDWDTGEDLVPKPKSEGQTTARSRAGEAQNDQQTHLTSWPYSTVSTLYATSDCNSLVWTVFPFQQTYAAFCTYRNILHTDGLQYVSSLQRWLLCGASLEELFYSWKHFWFICWTYWHFYICHTNHEVLYDFYIYIGFLFNF